MASAILTATVAGAAEPLSAPVTGIPCYDDAGPRVSVFYFYATGQPNDLADQLPVIRDGVAQLDATLVASAARTGGVRHIAVRTGPGCVLEVTPVAVPDADLAKNLKVLTDLGKLPAGDSALAFVGPSLSTGLGGRASWSVDDRPGADNAANKGGRLAEVAFPFWDDGNGAAFVVARMLGAVQPSAPHGSSSGHCTDGADPLCFDDRSIPRPLQDDVCGPGGLYLLDCGADDYFSTSPAPGSYLADHWNVADSVFLRSTPPAALDAVEPVSVTLSGIPSDGRVGPQTVLKVDVVDSAPVQSVSLVSDSAPGIQPITVSGSSATGSLRGLNRFGPGTVFALVTDKLGRSRRSPVAEVTYVRGVKLAAGSESSAVSGVIPFTATLDLSGDQLGVRRMRVVWPRTETQAGAVLAEAAYAPGQSTYTGTIDTALLPDADGVSVVLALYDSADQLITGATDAVRLTVANRRPALSLGIADGQRLSAPAQLAATVTGGTLATTRMTYVSTSTTCAAGRTLGVATEAPWAVSYDPRLDWAGPQGTTALCVTATFADGTASTIGPIAFTQEQPDAVQLTIAPGTKLTVGRNNVPISVRASSRRALQSLQLFETSRLFGEPGHLVATLPVTGGATPTSIPLDVRPGTVGTTELYVRAVFEKGEGEYVRSGDVPVSAVVGPAPTMSVQPAPPTIASGAQALVTGTAPAGSQLRLWAASAPSSTFKVIRDGTVGADGKYGILIRPTTTTRVYTEVVGGKAAAAKTVSVRSLITMSVVRTGRLTYRFSGRVAPKRAGVAVTVAVKTGSTSAAALVRVRTLGDGTWSGSFRFPQPRVFDVFATTVADSVNLAGTTPLRRLSVS